MRDERLLCVGLTGGIGSGKSTVANLFAHWGASLIDTDQIAHQLTGVGGQAMPALREAFGVSALTADGALDRTYMREQAFANPAQRARLEAILHPLIRAETDRQLLAARGCYAMLVVPLLTESAHYRARCDRIVVVDCPEHVQVQRVMARNGMSEAEVRRIIAAQARPEVRRALADWLIHNADGIETLQPQVEAVHKCLLLLASAQ